MQVVNVYSMDGYASNSAPNWLYMDISQISTNTFWLRKRSKNLYQTIAADFLNMGNGFIQGMLTSPKSYDRVYIATE